MAAIVVLLGAGAAVGVVTDSPTALTVAEDAKRELDHLGHGQELSADVASDAIALHGFVASSLLPHSGDRWLTSFVSKYLHFHAAVVPIIDTFVEASITRFVTVDEWATAQRDVRTPETYDRRYRLFVLKFYALYQKLKGRDARVPLSVKGIDHMLWRGNTSKK